MSDVKRTNTGRQLSEPVRMHPWDFVHISPGPTKVVKREFGGNRWCFKCRKHHDHQATLLDYEEPSYHEPIWVLACAGCGEDHTVFGS